LYIYWLINNCKPLSCRVLPKLYFSFSPWFPFFLRWFRSMASMNSCPEIEDLVNQTSVLGWIDTPHHLFSSSVITTAASPSFTLVGKTLSSQLLSKVIIKNNLLQAWKFMKSLILLKKETITLWFFCLKL
jgi:hypothetical protein